MLNLQGLILPPSISLFECAGATRIQHMEMKCCVLGHKNVKKEEKKECMGWAMAWSFSELKST